MANLITLTVRGEQASPLGIGVKKSSESQGVASIGIKRVVPSVCKNFGNKSDGLINSKVIIPDGNSGEIHLYCTETVAAVIALS